VVLQRLLLSTLLLAGAHAAARAQNQSESSPLPLEILKLKWERQVQLPRNFDPSTIPMTGVFNDANTRNTINPPTSAADATRNATSAQSNAQTSQSVAFPATPSRLPVVYVYSMRVKNIGGKTIEGVAWDYVFVDVTSNKEVGRHQFLSFETLKDQKETTFSSQLRSPPTRIVQTTEGNSGSKEHPKYTGRAIIQCVLYADDTAWRGPQASSDICALLKTQRDLRRKKHAA
jgi:hypothetical protein